MKKIIAILLTVLLMISGCAPRNDIQTSSQPSPQQTSGIKEAAPDESELQSMREYAITFAESFSEPFASVDELDSTALGRFAMMQLYLAHENELETDNAGYPYIPNAQLKDYMSIHFGMENYIYPQQPQSDQFIVLPLYDAEKDAYLFGAVGDGSLVRAEIADELAAGQAVTYTMRMERKDFETGKAAEAFEMDYRFHVFFTGNGYGLRALSAVERRAYPWTDDSHRIDRLAGLQSRAGIREETEIKELVGSLLDKAWYLCYLAYNQPYVEGQQIYASAYNPEEKVEHNGSPFYPAVNLPYHSTAAIWEDVYSVFDKPTADGRFSFISTLYADIDGRLYCNGGADGQSRGRVWDAESMVVESVGDSVIRLRMDVRFMDSEWSDTLELAFTDGVWKLGDSYFANPS